MTIEEIARAASISIDNINQVKEMLKKYDVNDTLGDVLHYNRMDFQASILGILDLALNDVEDCTFRIRVNVGAPYPTAEMYYTRRYGSTDGYVLVFSLGEITIHLPLALITGVWSEWRDDHTRVTLDVNTKITLDEDGG